MNDQADTSAGGPAAGQPLTEAGWVERLKEINPWARGFDLDNVWMESDAEFEKARQAACIARWKAGRAVWNAWAEAMLALQREAEAAGLWDLDDTAPQGSEPFNEGTRAHFALGKAHFTGIDFGPLCRPTALGIRRVNFAAFEFPYLADFTQAVLGRKNSNPAKSLFSGAKFGYAAWFNGAQFGSKAEFHGTKFARDVRFSGTQFGGEAEFEGARFGGCAQFGGTHKGNFTRFEKRADFSRVQIIGIQYILQYFPESQWLRREAELRAAPWVTFAKGADFSDVEFDDDVFFNEARFEGLASFRAISPKKTLSFADARFRRPPDFIGVKFAEPPRLDNLVIEDPLDWERYRPFSRLRGQPRKSLPDPMFPRRTDGSEPDPRLRGGGGWWRRLLYSRMRVARDGDEHARFRKLREMAAAAKDHEQEVQNNAHEIAAQRFWAVSPYRRGEWLRFWLGWSYQIFSDYGRSVLRPLAVGAAQIIAFALIFLLCARLFSDPAQQTGQNPTACHSTFEAAQLKVPPEQRTSRAYEAFALSLRGSLIYERTDAPRRIYGCLFGVSVSKEGIEQPTIPLSIVILSSLQTLLTGVLFFLSGLAVRNQFRMR